MPAGTDHALERRRAAERSLDYVASDMLLGLGSGSTVAVLIDMLGVRVRAGLRIRAVCASNRSRRLAEAAGIPLLDENAFSRLDLTIDGADELDSQLRAIKGGGAAMLREKIVAAAAERFILIADSRKPVAQLGAAPVPVEVVPFGWPSVARRLAALGTEPALRRDLSGAPIVTDNGNHLLDCRFGTIADPEALAARLAAIPGVLAHGLFLGLATLALIGRGENVEVLQRPGAGASGD